ncbi:MAG: SDR family oxidoreductase [Actinobacteria bacterium]|nr:SDR family oxidoreductase [Actinomycetota bacterium]
MPVNALAPGPTDTGALDRSGLPTETVAAIDRAEAVANPLGRRGHRSEVAAWILHLPDPAATWITGQVVDVDGGAGLVGHPSVAAGVAEGCQ